MADYQSLLTRAVANLPSSSPAAARQAIYDRARKALLTQLRTLRPPLPESDITREENALNQAIAQVEAKFGGTDAAQAEPTPSKTAPSAPGQPAVERPRAAQARAGKPTARFRIRPGSKTSGGAHRACSGGAGSSHARPACRAGPRRHARRVAASAGRCATSAATRTRPRSRSGRRAARRARGAGQTGSGACRIRRCQSA